VSVEKCCFCGRKCVFSLRGHCSPLSTRKECRCVSPLFSGTYDTKMTKSKTDSKIWGTMCLSVEAYIVSVDRFVASARGLGCWLLLGHSGAGSSSAARSSKTPWDNRFWSIAGSIEQKPVGQQILVNRGSVRSRSQTSVFDQNTPKPR